MPRLYTFILACLSLVVITTADQGSCPSRPVVLHSTLVSICSQEPARSAIGCSMYRLCTNTTLDPPIFSALCDTWRVASSLCSDDQNITDSIGLCTQLQASYSDAAQFRSCMVPYGMRSTSQIRDLHLGACGAMSDPSTMLGCLDCTTESCPDPLVAYSRGCYDMDMGHCEPWLLFCSSDASPSGKGAAVLCLNPMYNTKVVAPPRPPSPPPDRHTPLPGPPSPPALLPQTPPGTRPPASPAYGGQLASPPLPPGNVLQSTSPSPPSRQPPETSLPPPSPSRDGPTPLCVTNPSLPECSSFEYPLASIAADQDSLCTSMPYMPGCTIRVACQAGRVTGDFCRPMTLLATICFDMPSMGGCKSYVAMCRNGSVVQQCKQFPAIPGLPSTLKARQAVMEMCNSMEMTQCETCTAQSCKDYIGPMSIMCTEMPFMDGCDVYAGWCEKSAVWSTKNGGNGSVSFYCGGADVYGGASSSSDIPSMLMFFHQRTREILLFRTWLPKTTGQAVGSFIAIVGISFASVGLRTAQYIMLTAAGAGRLGLLAPPQHPHVPWWLPSGRQALLNFVSSVVTLVVSTLDLFAMLIAMTFNGAYFAAVVLGYALATLLLGHLRENYHRHLGTAVAAADDVEFCCGVAVAPATFKQNSSSKGSLALAMEGTNGSHARVAFSGSQIDINGQALPK